MGCTKKILSFVFAIVGITIAYAQSSRAACEVASIKPNKS